MSTPFRIFIDVDGVLSFWIKAAAEVAGLDINDPEMRQRLKTVHTIDEVTGRDFWDAHEEPKKAEWWDALEVLPWANSLYDLCNEIAPTCILTSPGPFAGAAAGKHSWISRNFTEKHWLIGSEKYYAAHPHAILIDDYQKKLKEFKKWEGHVFEWPNPLSLLDGDVDLHDTFQSLTSVLYNLRKQYGDESYVKPKPETSSQPRTSADRA